MERKMIVHDYTMIEDNQNVEAFKKELGERVDTLKTKIFEKFGKKVDTLETEILDMKKMMVDMKNLMERKT